MKRGSQVKKLNTKELKKTVADLEPSFVEVSQDTDNFICPVKVVRIISKHFEKVPMFMRISLLAMRLSKRFDDIFVVEPLTPEEDALVKSVKSKRRSRKGEQ
jgi:hypothetical protein